MDTRYFKGADTLREQGFWVAVITTSVGSAEMA